MRPQLTTGYSKNPISLRDGASAVFRRRGLVLFIFLAVVAGTILVTLLLPNRYDSRMKILVKNQRVDVAITPEATNGLSAPSVENDVSENQINSEIELLTSKDLLTQVVKDTGLASNETSLFGRPATEPERVEKAVNQLTKDLKLQKTAEAKTKMLDAEAALNEATNRIARVEQQLDSMPKRIVTQSRQLPNQYSAERLNTMMVELQNKRTQLLTKYRPEDRLVREVDAQIRTTQDALSRAEGKTSVEEATDLNPLRQTLETELSRARLDQAGARARRDTLAAQLQQYDESLKKLEGDTTKHDDLQRQKKEAEDNYQLYAKKREEARIADELDRQKITNVSIAEAPAVAQIPASPNRALNLVLGVVLATFLTAGSAFSAELLNDTVHTARQLEALTGATVLATVPENSRRLISHRRRPPGTIETKNRSVGELQ